eukprot:scaffold5674_cov129-Isochrysis_galbana.AAC.1
MEKTADATRRRDSPSGSHHSRRGSRILSDRLCAQARHSIIVERASPQGSKEQGTIRDRDSRVAPCDSASNS